MNEKKENTMTGSQRRLTDGMSPQELQAYKERSDAIFEEFAEQLHKSNLEEAERIARWKGERSLPEPQHSPVVQEFLDSLAESNRNEAEEIALRRGETKPGD